MYCISVELESAVSQPTHTDVAASASPPPRPYDGVCTCLLCHRLLPSAGTPGGCGVLVPFKLVCCRALFLNPAYCTLLACAAGVDVSARDAFPIAEALLTVPLCCAALFGPAWLLFGIASATTAARLLIGTRLRVCNRVPPRTCATALLVGLAWRSARSFPAPPVPASAASLLALPRPRPAWRWVTRMAPRWRCPPLRWR